MTLKGTRWPCKLKESSLQGDARTLSFLSSKPLASLQSAAVFSVHVEGTLHLRLRHLPSMVMISTEVGDLTLFVSWGVCVGKSRGYGVST